MTPLYVAGGLAGTGVLLLMFACWAAGNPKTKVYGFISFITASLMSLLATGFFLFWLITRIGGKNG